MPGSSTALEASRLQLSELYGPVAEELAATENLLRRELTSRHALLDSLLRYSARLAGKRLRPALLLLSAQAAGGVREGHRVLAAVIEMIHTATLVHDDILDGATLRRHAPTVNARWDAHTAILLGDLLFSHAFYLSSTLGDATLCAELGRATNAVCAGELRQAATSGRFELSEAEYFSVIEAKTAALCACACFLGARYAGATEEQAASLREYGRHLGIAFQIADDLLDFDGDEAEAGKSLGTDLAQLKPTLPLIHLLEQANPVERSAVEATVRTAAREGRAVLQAELQNCGALEYTRVQARHFAGQAKAQLACLPDSAARQVLERLSDYVIERRT